MVPKESMNISNFLVQRRDALEEASPGGRERGRSAENEVDQFVGEEDHYAEARAASVSRARA